MGSTAPEVVAAERGGLGPLRTFLVGGALAFLFGLMVAVLSAHPAAAAGLTPTGGDAQAGSLSTPPTVVNLPTGLPTTLPSGPTAPVPAPALPIVPIPPSGANPASGSPLPGPASALPSLLGAVTGGVPGAATTFGGLKGTVGSTGLGPVLGSAASSGPGGALPESAPSASAGSPGANPLPSPSAAPTVRASTRHLRAIGGGAVPDRPPTGRGPVPGPGGPVGGPPGSNDTGTGPSAAGGTTPMGLPPGGLVLFVLLAAGALLAARRPRPLLLDLRFSPPG